MIPAKQFDLCPWGKLIAMPHMGWQHAGWFASYVVNAKNILEWGCGGSTLWMVQMTTGKVLSIEHNKTWRDRIRKGLLLIEHCWMRAQVTGPQYVHDAKDYVAGKDVQADAPYDLIFIDGHEREACLTASYDLLAPGGVVFLHDSQRAEYTDAKRMLLERKGMTLIDERVDESWVNPIAGMWAVQQNERDE
jgi:predicted O-methyltransferase YrrM